MSANASLELGIVRRARERDDVADVGHAGDEEEQALETEAEARVISDIRISLGSSLS